MHIQFFVNIVNIMNKLIDPEKSVEISQKNSQFSQRTVYVREDDQDWGSAGMNDIQKDSE